MPTVVLRQPLKDLAGGSARLDVPGTTVGEVLSALETAHPGIKGWVLDEQGRIRTHVNVFVDGDKARAERTVTADTELDIIQAISGGQDDVEVLVGTRKGLFVLRGPRGGDLELGARSFEGAEVEYAIRDPRSGTYYASVTSGFYGPHLFYSGDPEKGWEQAEGPAFPEDAGSTVTRIWTIQPGQEDGVLWAGVAPAALFRSEDSGRTWSLNRGLWDQPTRPQWEGGAGGLCVHSICPWPGDPDRIAIGISAVGVWLSEDRGHTWRRGVEGLVPRYVPEDAPTDSLNLCVHNMHRAPVEPTTLYMQFHGGVYRSDDAGETWTDVGSDGGLPSDFGFPLIVDPTDPNRAFVIPLGSDGDRVTPGGAVRVFESSDRGATWRSSSQGLPQNSAYLTILRQAFGHDGREPLGLYFGATSGDVFGSTDGGASWRTLARYLPPVLSVRCA